MNPGRFVVYADMVGDLFHGGHVSFLRRARTLAESRATGRPIWMIVGLMSDHDARDYKRRPVLSLAERREVVGACRLVDDVVAPCPLRIDRDLIEAHDIDLVVHGDDFDADAIADWYGEAVNLGIFATVPYTDGIDDAALSTSEIIDRIRTRSEAT